MDADDRTTGELKLDAIQAFLKPISEAAKSASTKKSTGEL